MYECAQFKNKINILIKIILNLMYEDSNLKIKLN